MTSSSSLENQNNVPSTGKKINYKTTTITPTEKTLPILCDPAVLPSPFSLTSELLQAMT